MRLYLLVDISPDKTKSRDPGIAACVETWIFQAAVSGSFLLQAAPQPLSE
jgi:hypothetical protein